MEQDFLRVITDQIRVAKNDSQARVIIIDRRVCVGFHNGWSLVNSRGLNNSVGLKEKLAEYIQGQANPQDAIK